MAALACPTCVAPSRSRGWRGFTLPRALEASAPVEVRLGSRDALRMLVTENGRTQHRQFTDLARVLRAEDLLVVNDSATLPAALEARTDDGRPLSLHLSTPLPQDPRPQSSSPRAKGPPFTLDTPHWVVEARGLHGEVAAGMRLSLGGGAQTHLLRPYQPPARRLWIASFEGVGSMHAYLGRWGRPITYPYVTERWPLDAYQTLFARVPGSAEMPSAARGFTPRIVRDLAKRGVSVARITLHTGVASPEHDEAPYAEYFEVPEETVRRIHERRLRGGRVIAVGTTVIRALESALDGSVHLHATHGWTSLAIDPTRRLHSVDGLLTGLHEPRASHLQMLLALVDGTTLQDAYDKAVACRYRWHEFGDLHLILN